MWWPWHWDQAGQDEADARADAAQAADEEADFVAMLEAHSDEGPA